MKRLNFDSKLIEIVSWGPIHNVQLLVNPMAINGVECRF